MRKFFQKRNFKKALTESLADNHLSDTEKTALTKLADELGIDESFYQELKELKLKSLSEPVVKDIINSGRLSPDDEKTLTEYANNLGLKLDIHNHFYVERALWESENSKKFKPKAIHTDLNLKRSENCYLETPCIWQHTSESQWALSARVRFGLLAPNEIGTHSSRGHLYLTKKRIIFVGQPKHFDIRLNKIVDFGHTDENVFSLVIYNGEYIDLIIEKNQADYLCILLEKF